MGKAGVARRGAAMILTLAGLVAALGFLGRDNFFHELPPPGGPDPLL
jgi:hypothetical protein